MLEVIAAVLMIGYCLTLGPYTLGILNERCRRKRMRRFQRLDLGCYRCGDYVRESHRTYVRRDKDGQRLHGCRPCRKLEERMRKKLSRTLWLSGALALIVSALTWLAYHFGKRQTSQ